MTAVTLRPATGADAPGVTTVFLAARAAMTYLPDLHTGDQAARFFFDLVTTAQVQVAECGGVVVGFAAVRHGWLEHLNVTPVRQSRGIGSRLIEWAKEVSPQGLDLWVFQRNSRARALYESHGWRLVTLTEGADNEEGQPDAHLRWEPPGAEPVTRR